MSSAAEVQSRLLSPYVEDFDGFKATLRDTVSVVVGNEVLNAITGRVIVEDGYLDIRCESQGYLDGAEKLRLWKEFLGHCQYEAIGRPPTGAQLVSLG